MWKNAVKTMKDINGRVTKSNPTHDDLVAGLTLGRWTSLLPIPQGSIIDLIGFAIGHDFALVATLEVKSFIEKYPQGAGIPYKDLIVA